ncbi:hypothetical protein F4804DRAFT_312939 [Jackrogersella minutella]|nr:hypothetical protein F4804DRAFT_312939 [Jackrogersella minutella]
MVHRGTIQDMDISIRFKYGIHTICIFVDPMQPFTDVAEELLQVLRDRYPQGLSISPFESDKTELPDDPQQIEFGLPNAQNDLSKGWKPLEDGNQETPVGAGLKDNNVVAFTFKPLDADEDFEPEFTVKIPNFEDEASEPEEE